MAGVAGERRALTAQWRATMRTGENSCHGQAFKSGLRDRLGQGRVRLAEALLISPLARGLNAALCDRALRR